MSTFPALPRASAVWQSLSDSVASDTTLPFQVKAAFTTHVSNLISTLHLSQPASEAAVARQEARLVAVEGNLRSTVELHKMDPQEISRFKRPTGHEDSPIGNCLFYPPSSNPRSQRHVLVHGPDTTSKMISAGVDARVYTCNTYSFSTDIPFGGKAYMNVPFFGDSTLPKDTSAATDIFNILSNDAAHVFRHRLYLPGVDVIWGQPVQDAWIKATLSPFLLKTGWRVHRLTAKIVIPAITNANGVFLAQTFVYTWYLPYIEEYGGVRFGKLAIFHEHPCAVSSRLRAGALITSTDWARAVFTDVLVDVLVQHSCGTPAIRTDNARLFAFVGQPQASKANPTVNYMVRSTLRNIEKTTGVNFAPEELPEGVLPYITSKFELDRSILDVKSALGQACSDATKRSWDARRTTPSAEDPSKTVAEMAQIKRKATELQPISEGSSISRVQAKHAKRVHTQKTTMSPISPTKTLDQKRIEKLVETKRSTASTERPGFTVQEAATQKRHEWAAIPENKASYAANARAAAALSTYKEPIGLIQLTRRTRISSSFARLWKPQPNLAQEH